MHGSGCTYVQPDLYAFAEKRKKGIVESQFARTRCLSAALLQSRKEVKPNRIVGPDGSG
jgi:RNase P/RNase MRP subunit POP5